MLGRAVSDAGLLAGVLADPERAAALDAGSWAAVMAVARAEQLAGTLAHRLAGLPVPEPVARWLADAREAAEQARRTALWEAEMVRRALAPLGCRTVLLKGTAYVAAGLSAGQGRQIGDCDILVPREALPAVEAALIGAGWEWAKPDAYDNAYYRRWMHELPPLIHEGRDRMVDVHHTILPPTARITPDAEALIADAVPLGDGLHVLSPADRIIHAAAHLFADGDLSGGLRNLWDIRCLLDDGAAALEVRAAQHGLGREVTRAMRLAHRVFGAAVPDAYRQARASDAPYLRRLLARDGWGRATRRGTRLGFYVRSHWLRMPPALLARHLWIKWRRGPA